MKKIPCYILFLTALILFSCNKEADILPDSTASLIKLIPGDRDEIPVSLSLIQNGDYLIVSNSSAFIDGLSVSKIRLIRMNKAGEVLFDKNYPDNNSLSWSAKTVHIIDDKLFIGGNSKSSNMLFLKLDESGDSLQFATEYPNKPFYLDSKVAGNKIRLMTTDGINNMYVQDLSPNDLSLDGNFSKSFVADTIPAASLLIKGDTIGFATRQTINYSLWPSEQDLDEDATLKKLKNASNYKINYLLNTPQDKTALAFGVVTTGANSKWFTTLSDVKENDREPQPKIYDQSIAFNDIMKNVQVEDDHILICGTREAVGATNSKFLLMKVDYYGRLQFSRSFGSSTSENELYDAIWDNGCIVTIGTTAFGGKESIVITTLSETGRLIR